MNIAVVTDSTSDISKKLAEEKNINIVPLNVHFGLKTYLDGIDIDSNTFYKRLLEGDILPTTSAPSAGTFIETYKKLSKTHDGIIRSSKKAIQKMHDLANLNGPYESAAIIYSTDQTEPSRLKNQLELNTSNKNILSLQLGPVVGTYGGPNVLGYAGIRSD